MPRASAFASCASTMRCRWSNPETSVTDCIQGMGESRGTDVIFASPGTGHDAAERFRLYGAVLWQRPLRSAVPPPQFRRGDRLFDALGQAVVLLPDGAGEAGAERLEEGVLALDGLGPFVGVDAKQLGDCRVRDVQAAQVEGRSGGHVADRGVGGAGA